MNRCIGIRAPYGVALCGCLTALFIGGCSLTPRNVSWLAKEDVVQPEVKKAADAAEYVPHGSLVMELPPHTEDLSDQDPQHYPIAYLYDSKGQFLEELPPNTRNPITLSPGQYIVLVGDEDPMGEFHQVQIRISENRTTYVNLDQIRHAPSFWSLSRALSK
jgi:hypothetical protein